MQAAPERTWESFGSPPSTVGFLLRAAITGTVFLGSTYYAVDTLVRAVGGFGISHSPAPSFGDVGWAFLLGPGPQLAIALLVVGGLRLRRPTRMGRLRALTWWLVAIDVVLVIIILMAVGVATI
jgi:hypothetical protein